MIDRKALFKDLASKSKPKADDAEIEVEGDDGGGEDELAPYRQMLAAIKANDPEALKEALAACEDEE